MESSAAGGSKISSSLCDKRDLLSSMAFLMPLPMSVADFGLKARRARGWEAKLSGLTKVLQNKGLQDAVKVAITLAGGG